MDCFGTYFTHVQTYNNQQHLKPPWGILEAPFERWRLQALFKPPLSTLQGEAPLKPPSSFLQAEGFKPPSSPLEAPLKMKPPSSPLQAPSKPLQRWRLEALFKPPWSPLEAPFKPPWSPLQGEAPLKPPWSPLKRRWSPLEAPLKPSEGEAPFDLQTFVPPPWRVALAFYQLVGITSTSFSIPADSVK